MDGSMPERDDWEQDGDWEEAERGDYTLLPLVTGVALLLLVLILLRAV